MHGTPCRRIAIGVEDVATGANMIPSDMQLLPTLCPRCRTCSGRASATSSAKPVDCCVSCELIHDVGSTTTRLLGQQR